MRTSHSDAGYALACRLCYHASPARACLHRQIPHRQARRRQVRPPRPQGGGDWHAIDPGGRICRIRRFGGVSMPFGPGSVASGWTQSRGDAWRQLRGEICSEINACRAGASGEGRSGFGSGWGSTGLCTPGPPWWRGKSGAVGFIPFLRFQSWLALRSFMEGT